MTRNGKKRIWTAALAMLALMGCLVNVSCAAISPANAEKSYPFSPDDARTVLRAAVGLETLTGEQTARADLDDDGCITPADARLVLRTSVGLFVPVREDPGFDGQKEDVVDLKSLYTYEALEEDLSLLDSLMPSRFSYRSLGVTADGREIWCAVVGSGHGARQVVVDAGIHGSEYLNPAAVMYTVEYYLRNYDKAVYQDKTVREILEDTDLYFLPMLNPDGIAISQSGLDGLRDPALAKQVKAIYDRQAKAGDTEDSLSDYLRVWKANANGVDLNRNYLFEKTGLSYDTGVYAPANEEFAGDRKAPEAETAAYRALIGSLSHPVAVLSIHSQGNLIYCDCGEKQSKKKEDRQLAELIAKQTDYLIVDDDSFVGASADWTTIEKGIPSVTVECGKGHNPLPLGQQAEIAMKLKNVFLAVADAWG